MEKCRAKINISAAGGTAFADKKRSLGHDVRLLSFYEDNSLCTTIYADFTEQTLVVENHIADPVMTAFGRNQLPAWEDFQDFLESRCIPRQRADYGSI